MKWTPDLIIALVLVVGSLALLFTGIDGEVKVILTVAAAWAFGTQYREIKEKKKSKEDEK